MLSLAANTLNRLNYVFCPTVLFFNDNIVCLIMLTCSSSLVYSCIKNMSSSHVLDNYFQCHWKGSFDCFSSWYKAWKAQWLLMGYMVRVKIPNPNSWEGDFISSAHHPFACNIFRFLTSVFLSCFFPTTCFSAACTTCAKIPLITPGRHDPIFQQTGDTYQIGHRLECSRRSVVSHSLELEELE